jgi:dGTP triphosphohydrolase
MANIQRGVPMEEEYHSTVSRLEAGLLNCAKRSFESESLFVDGREVFAHFTELWKRPERRVNLRERTPIQIERDRILYSQGMRKQTEKYHVLYNGQRRIVRSYATHTMKMAQVSRAICRGLALNQDFAEAIALGAKVGAIPFVHAAKGPMSVWAEERIQKLDALEAKSNPMDDAKHVQMSLDFDGKQLPAFVSGIRSATVMAKVRKFMPWAAGQSHGKLYSSGQEGYWLLCTNPFLAEPRTSSYLPETMYGIWRHTLGERPGINPFHHRCEMAASKRGFVEITDRHATFEGMVVQYADDITWVIENLNDASEVAVLNTQKGVYDDVMKEISGEIPGALREALQRNDASAIYSYFINDFVVHSRELFSKLGTDFQVRDGLMTGEASLSFGLSSEAEGILRDMVKFLHREVFNEPRTRNRTEMLRSISVACVDLIHTSPGVLERVAEEQALLGRWSRDAKNSALALLADEVHRTQLSMDVLASWGDQEIYDFVGIQAL